MTDYVSNSYTASADWQEDDLVTDTDNPRPNITITNDDDTNAINIKLNSNLSDTIVVKAGETFTLYVPVIKIFYQAAAGTPAFRVLSDRENE